MDFVVLGFGLGALAVLIGLGMRDLGPLVRRVPRHDEMTWREVARRINWGRACRALGLLAALGGAVVCLVTLVMLIQGVSDRTGMTVVIVTLGLLLGAVGAWFLLDRWRGKAPDLLRVGGRLGGAVAGVRRRPIVARPPARASRRTARRTVPPPNGGSRTTPYPAPSSAHPATDSPTGGVRTDRRQRAATGTAEFDPVDDRDVDAAPPIRSRTTPPDSPSRRIESGR